MPTSKARLQVVTNPRVRTALERISAATGNSLGTIVREMIEEALPALEEMATALEAVPVSPGAALARMSRALELASADARQMGLELKGKSKTLVQQAARSKRLAQRKAARE
jgi:hypothetical protein